MFAVTFVAAAITLKNSIRTGLPVLRQIINGEIE
jgi:hypothetical protein